jgi:hypothetical protein
MIVANEMATLRPGIDESQPVHDIVQSPFQRNEQVGSGNSFLPFSPLEKQSELIFGKTVHPLYFLFFTKLNAVIGYFSATSLSMLTGWISAPIESTLVAVAPVTF